MCVYIYMSVCVCVCVCVCENLGYEQTVWFLPSHLAISSNCLRRYHRDADSSLTQTEREREREREKRDEHTHSQHHHDDDDDDIPSAYLYTVGIINNVSEMFESSVSVMNADDDDDDDDDVCMGVTIYLQHVEWSHCCQPLVSMS